MVRRTSAGPNFQKDCSRKCICCFENKHTQGYTRKMGDSVLRSFRTDEDIVKNRWCRSGKTKPIKENIRKKDPFEN